MWMGQIMSETSLSAALRNGIAWNTINALFSQTAGFIIFIILARALDPATFGAVALAAVLADFISNDGRYAGMDAILQRGDFEERGLNSAFMALGLVALPFSIILIIAGPFVAAFENAPLVGYYMPVFGLLVLLTPWLSVMDAIIMRNLGFKTFAQRNMLSTVIGGAAGIALAFSPLQLWALPAQRVVSIFAALAFEYRHTGWLPGFRSQRGALRDVLSRFIPLWMVVAINLSMQRAVLMVFGIRFDSATVGLFRAADRISESIQNPIISPLFALWFPLMSKVRGNQQEEGEIYTAIIRTASFVALPTFVGLFIVAGDIVTVLLPPSYAGVTPILRAVAITSLLIPIVWFNPIAMTAIGLNRISLKYSAALAVTCIGALVCIPVSTPAVAILIMSLPALFYGVFGNLLLLRRLGLKPLDHYRGLLPAAVASLVMGTITYYLQTNILADVNPSLRLGISASTGIIIYFGFLACFNRAWLMERVHLLLGRGR
jgi:O-antigen/teichoic acid export membrane protein